MFAKPSRLHRPDPPIREILAASSTSDARLQVVAEPGEPRKLGHARVAVALEEGVSRRREEPLERVRAGWARAAGVRNVKGPDELAVDEQPRHVAGLRHAHTSVRA